MEPGNTNVIIITSRDILGNVRKGGPESDIFPLLTCKSAANIFYITDKREQGFKTPANA